MYGAIEKGKELAGCSLSPALYIFIPADAALLLFSPLFSPKMIFCSYKGNDEKCMPLHFAGLFYY